MKKNSTHRSWRTTLLSLLTGLVFAGLSQAQEISFFGETDSAPPGSIADREIGDEPFTVEAKGEGGTIVIEITSHDPSVRGGHPVQAAVLVDGTISISEDPNDSALVTVEARLEDELGGVLDTETRTFTVRRDQTPAFVGLPQQVRLGDPSFEVNVTTSPDEGQVRGFRILDGPARTDSVTGRVNVYGTGAILLQAFAGSTNYNPLDPEADIVAARTLNKTLVVQGEEPTGGPGFLDVWSWREPQLSLTDNFNDISVNDAGDQFVAVGFGGKIIEGADAADPSGWTEPNSTVSEELMGVVWGQADSLWVAVGSDETVITSPDGVTWSNAGVSGIDPGDSLRDVAYDGADFVAVGTGVGGLSVLYTSPDGLSWTKDMLFFSFPAAPEQVSYSPALGIWQVVGAEGTWFYGDPGSWSINTAGFANDLNGILTTAEGVTYVVGDQGDILRTDPGTVTSWTFVNSGANYDLETIAINDRYLVAVGESGRILRSNLDNGERWSESITPFRFDVRAISFIDGLLLGVGQNYSLATSGSGFDWTLRDSSTPYDFQAVASDGSIAVAVGDDGEIFRSVDNGINWSDVSTAITEDLRDVVYSPAGFIAVGAGGAIFLSPDGSSWTAANSTDPLLGAGPFTGDLNAVHYNGMSYAAVGDDLSILTSADGDDWKQVTMGANDLHDVTSRGGTFVAVGTGGRAYSSTDGVHWKPRDTDVNNDLYAVTASDSEFLAVGKGGILLTSPNGITWTSRISTVTEDLFEALHWNGSFYAFGSGFALLVSNDSGDWESQVAPTQNTFPGATVTDELFVAVTELGGILTSSKTGSTGLEEWTFRNPGEAGDNINDITYGNKGFVAVGDSGEVLVSEDGRNWEKQNITESDGSPLTEDLLGVAFGNGLYLAVGGQKLVSSTDAQNWNVVTTWLVPVNSVSFGDGLFVVTGDASHILYSTNGIIWNGGGYNGANGAAPLRDSVYYPEYGLWVAVGDPASFILPDATEADMTQLFVSNDGQIWERQPSPKISDEEYFTGAMHTGSAGNNVVRGFGEGRLVYDPVEEVWNISALGGFTAYASLFTEGNGFGGFVYAGEGGAIAGVDPGLLSFPGITEDIRGLAFGAETYVAVGQNGRILNSSNALEWNIRSNENLEPLNAVAVDTLGRYVAVGGNATVLRSDDSVAWSPPAALPDLLRDQDLFAVEASADGFVAAGAFGVVLLSETGETWEGTQTPVLNTLYGVAIGGGNTVVVGEEGLILLNTGGQEWSEQEADGVTANLFDVAFGNDVFVTVGDSGSVLTSPDGSVWTSQTPAGISENLRGVGYGELAGFPYWTAVGESGATYVSVDDGVSWMPRDSGSNRDLRTVSFGQGNFLTAGADGTILSSGNSSDWFVRPIGTDYALNDAAFFNGVFTLVGDFQTIVTSGRIEERSSQEILFLPIEDKVIGDPAFEVQVAATSGLPVSVEIVSGPATVSGEEISLDGIAGTVVVRATQAGNVLFDAAEPVQESFDVLLSGQTIDFFGEPSSTAPGSVSDKTFGDDPFTVEATADSGLVPAIAVESGPATITAQSGGEATVSINGAGIVVLAASQAGDSTRSAAPEVTRSFAVGKSSQTIDFDAPDSAGEADPPLTLTASATSGLPVSFSVTSGPATISGDLLSFTGSGTVEVEASQAGNEDYNPAPVVTQTITVTPAETGDLWQMRTSGTTNDLEGVRFAGTGFLAVGANLSVLSSPEAQSWSLRASGGGVLQDVAYGGVPAVYLVIGRDGVPISSSDGLSWNVRTESGLPALEGIAYGDGRFVAVGAGGAIRRSLNGDSWSAVESGVTVDLKDVVYSDGTFVAVGSNAILVSENGGANWDVDTFAGDTISLNAVAGDGLGGFMVVGAGGQVLYSPDSSSSWEVRPGPTVSDLNAVVFGDGGYVIAGARGVLFSSNDAGLTWKARASGTTQNLNDGTYSQDVFVLVGDAGTILTSGLASGKAAQTIDFPGLSAPTGSTVDLAATALSGGVASDRKVEFSLIGGTGTIAGSVLDPVTGETTATLTISGNPGTYAVRASLPGGDDYLAVAGVDREFTVVGESQTITGLSPAAGDLAFSSAPIGLAATSIDANTDAPTGLAVNFEVVSGDATIEGSGLTLGSGAVGNDVTLRAFNSGNATYSPLDETFTYSITVEETEIVFNAIPDKLLTDDDFLIEARTSNGMDVGIRIIQGSNLISLRSETVNDGNGNSTLQHQVSIKGTDDAQGEVILEAFTPTGSTVTADPVRQSFYISKFRQNITFTDPGAKTFGDALFVVNASADGGGTVTLSLADSTVASLSGSTVTILSAGTIKITGTAEPNGDYGPATGELTVPVAKASQVLEFDAINDQFEGTVIEVPLFARTYIGSSDTSADPSSYPITFTLIEGADIASISGSTLKLNGGSGAVKVQASQPGTANVSAATPVERSFSVSNFGRAGISATQSFKGAAYGAGTFVAVGSQGSVARTVDLSSDASDWQALVPGPTPRTLQDVAFGGGRFVAVGSFGTTLVSTDGAMNWSVGSVGTTSVMNAVEYGLGRFVAVDSSTSGGIRTSSSGFSWSAASVPTVNRLRDVTLGSVNGTPRFVAVGFAGSVVTSTNGTSWTQRQTGTQNLSLWSVAYGDGLFLAITTGRDYLFSENGITWTRAAIPESVMNDAGLLKAVSFGNTTFRVVGENGTVLTASTEAVREPTDPSDGSSRWVREISLGTETLNNVSFGGDRFVAVGNNGTILVSLPEEASLSLADYIDSIDFSGLTAAPVTGSDDPDGDGQRVAVEYALAGDPLTPEPGPLVEMMTSGGEVRLCFNRRLFVSVTIEIQESSDMSSWTTIRTYDPSTGSWDNTSGLSESVTGSTVHVEFAVTDTAPATFLRVRIIE